MKGKAILLVLFFFSIDFYAQNRDDIEKDIGLFAACVDSNPEQAFRHIDKAYHKSIALKNDSLIARTSCNLGYYYYTKSNFAESKRKCYESVFFSKKTHYYKILASSYNQLGMIAFEEDRFNEALKWYLMALKMADNKQFPNIRSRVLINLGYLHLIQKDTAKAIGYYNENIKNAAENDLYKELAIGYETVANLHSGNNKPKADALYNKALAIVKKNKDLYTEFRLYVDLSDLYLASTKSTDSDKVCHYLRKAHDIQRILNDESLLFYIYFNFGSYYLNKRQYDQSLEFYHKSLALSKKNITSGQVLKLYKVLSAAYIYRNDYKNALLFNERSNNLKDSLYNIKKDKIFNEIQTKYEVDKKNLKIKLLTKEQEMHENKKRAILVAGLFLMGLLTVIVLWLRHRMQSQKLIRLKENKILRQEIVKLEQDQELKRMKGVLEGQDQERNRLSIEIHDGIGGSLAGIKLQLSQVNATLKNEKLHAIEHQMAAAFNELRSVSHNLNFNFMIDKNLEHLLYQLKADYENRGEFKMDLIIFPQGALGVLKDEVKRHVYRIVQELLANVSKHADAKNVMLGFTSHDDMLNIIIEDDGVGFVTAGASGIGLKNIRERLAALKGTIVIESSPGNGTTILMDIPIQEK